MCFAVQPELVTSWCQWTDKTLPLPWGSQSEGCGAGVQTHEQQLPHSEIPVTLEGGALWGLGGEHTTPDCPGQRREVTKVGS